MAAKYQLITELYRRTGVAVAVESKVFRRSALYVASLFRVCDEDRLYRYAFSAVFVCKLQSDGITTTGNMNDLSDAAIR